jgi:hypothetical protein
VCVCVREGDKIKDGTRSVSGLFIIYCNGDSGFKMRTSISFGAEILCFFFFFYLSWHHHDIGWF